MPGSKELGCCLLGACGTVLLLYALFLPIFPAASASGHCWSQGTSSPAAGQHGRSEHHPHPSRIARNGA